MAGLYDKQAAIYLDARPRYPSEWFSMLASLTPDHSLAWDAGTGNGQAAIDVSDHYKQVIATDISEEQLKHAIQHPQVQYFHSPSSMSEDELVNLVGGENSVDLVIAATAVHWFDLEKFYPVVKRVLKKPGGVVAVWSYNVMQVIPEMDPLLKKFRESTFPFQNPKVMYAYECYKTLPFPFESVGVGCEGKPLELDMPREMSFERLLKLLSSASAVNTAKEQGSELCAPQDPLECVTDSFDGFISTNELSILEDFGDFFGKSEEEIKTTPSGDFEPGTTKKKPRSKRRLKQGAWSMKDFVLSALENHEFPKRICTHRQTDNTPQWRIGPMGPKTLCNACGVRYSTGRLFPEYRPAASPSFDHSKHSKFHKQILRRRANLIH